MEEVELQDWQDEVPSDLTDLGDLTSNTVLEVVKKRFQQDEIYTSGGGHDILLSVNPFKDLHIYTNEYHEKYRWETLKPNDDPHIFAITTKAYKRLRESKKNQVVLITGESGSGKTENTKLMVKHLIWLCESKLKDLHTQIVEVNPLLEAFGNAKTVLNNNSSRFAKYLEIGFGENGHIIDATIRDYMLEKSRVVFQSEGEGNFHIFYSLLAGMEESEKKTYKFDSNHFRIAPKPFPKPKKEYAEEFKKQIDVMKMIGMTEEEIANIKTILAGILHVTNIEFSSESTVAVEVKDERPLFFAATLLGIDVEQFAKYLVIRKIKVGGEIIDCLNSKTQADEGRDAVAKFLYERLFGWLVRQVNTALHKSKSNFSAAGSVGILDICGFETLRNNGFEQLCVNIVNEKLQMFMNDKIFRREKEIYESEGLEWSPLDYMNNQDIVEMFLDEKTGMLYLIDEDTKFQQATDTSLVSKLDDRFGGNKYYHKTKNNRPEFYIQHFAGSVKYNASGFLEKNGNELSPEILKCLVASDNELVSDLFTVQPTNTGTISGTPFQYRMSRRHVPSSHKPQVSRLTQGIVRGTMKSLHDRFGGAQPNTGSAVVELQSQKTVVAYFRNSMKELLTKMNNAEARFVRCVKPNEHLAPDEFEDEKVLEQLQYNGIAEVAQIRKLGYPIRFPYDAFMKRFKLVEPECTKISNKQEAVRSILRAVHADPSTYQLGKQQVFLKEGINEELSEELAKKMEKFRKEQQVIERKRREEERKRTEEEEKRKIIRHEQASQLIQEMNAVPNSLPPIPEVATPNLNFNHGGPSIDINTTTSNSTFSNGSNTNSEPSNPLLPPRVTSQEAPEPKKKEVPVFWDIFRIVDLELPTKDVHDQLPLKVVKVLFYLLSFLLLLGSCVMHKVSLMVYLPQLKQDWNGAKTILILAVVLIPYGITSFFAFFKWLFGGFGMPSASTFAMVFFMESFHSLGMCLLIFRVLPNVNTFTGISMFSAVAILPGLLKLVCSRELKPEASGRNTRLSSTSRHVICMVLDISALLAQLCIIPVAYFWNDFTGNKETVDYEIILTVVAAFLFVSFGSWENFIDDRLFFKIKEDGFGSFILKARYELQEGRSGLFMLTHTWKIILTILLAYLLRDNLNPDLSLTVNDFKRMADNMKNFTPIIILGISSWVCYYIGYLACKLRMQIISFSIPLLLSTPVAYCVFWVNCKYRMLSYIMTENASECPDSVNHWYHIVAGIGWWISLLWVSRHIWFPHQENLAKFERLFMNPMYCAILTTENLLLDRRRHTLRFLMHRKQDYKYNVKKTYTLPIEQQFIGNFDGDHYLPADSQNADVPRIYACATMWHENRVEMVQLLKSLHRLDADQWNRKQAMMISGQNDPNFYEYEAHIFFDDAMEVDIDGNWVANSYVKMLVSLMGEACSCVHNRPMSVHNPYKVITEYGAQLVWQMPGENLLYVHVKDKNKIRHRKRWSQVMYMYYLLGYRLTKESEDELIYAIENDQLNSKSRLAIFEHLNDDVVRKSENTFILALDGDTDFMPGAVRLLVDRMRKGQKVGAACGRIHPIGSGPLVWYQKFEYALGHWLQKATEHVLGCVLCSPGCFSLFRGSALMDDNIIRKYAILPTEPGHYLQYDQGEDRWLCTLLLKQGYRVDYVAAADAYTYAPEGFNEFFNQRRRWMPSTLANINDLLTSSSITVTTNSNISQLYIWYQMAIMAGTVLGPGTVIMMIAGSIQAVFDLDLPVCYVIGILPPALFVVACYYMKPNHQLIVAAALSTAYAFLMMVVLTGTLITAVKKGPLHPNVIFFVGMIAIFLIAGILHYKELYCLPPGLLYMISLPAGYLVLVIYSLCNLYNVSWGTREAPKRKTQTQLDEEKQAKEEKKKDGFFTRIFLRSSYMKDVKDLLKSVGSIAGNISGKKDDIDDNKILQSLNELNVSLNQINQNILRFAPGGTGLSVESTPVEVADKSCEPKEEEILVTRKSILKPSVEEPPSQESLPVISSDAWLNDPDLGNGPTLVVNEEEGRFWKIFIEKYLKPLEKDEQKETEIKAGLLQLRNDYVFTFIMLNGLWIALNYMFQDKRPFEIPLSYTVGTTYYNFKLEILGVLFVIFFLFILLVQFAGMLAHRWGTLQHMISVTELNIFKRKFETLKDTVHLDDALKFCQSFNHEPVPDYDDEDEETKPSVLETAVVLGKSLHIKPELGKSVRETILTKGTILGQNQSNGVPDLMKSIKQGIPLYLRGSGINETDGEVDSSAVSVVRNLRQSMISGKVDRPFSKKESSAAVAKRLPSAIRRVHLHDTTSHVIKRVKQAGVRFALPEEEEAVAEDDEPDNVYESLDVFGQGTMGRGFARRMKFLQDSLKLVNNGHPPFSVAMEEDF